MKQICSVNGEISPILEANLPLSSIETQYNFGVYESIKVRNGNIYFTDKHINRLFHSASKIELTHSFDRTKVEEHIYKFITELQEESCNVKVLLYGGKEQTDAKLILLASAPYYPNRKWYKEGVSLTSFTYERWMPQAKTLNMLPSYYYYQKAKQQGAYDALLLDRKGDILEGTRTNIFVLKGKTIISPPKEFILEGVTLMSLEKIIIDTEFSIKYQSIPFNALRSYDGMILASTSSKILPVKKIDNFTFSEITHSIRELIKIYDTKLEQSKGIFDRL